MSEAVTAARAVLEQFQDQALAESALAAVSEWVKTGKPPASMALRSDGYRKDGPHAELVYVRSAFYRHWGCAIPCAEAVEALVSLSPLVEIGAGTGLWSAMLRAAGADIIATDAVAEGALGAGRTIGAHSSVQAMGGADAVRAYADRAVFCCFPTLNDEWCADAASAMRPGQILALIARQRGGPTGSAALYDLLETGFALARRVEIPQFPGEDDDLRIYRRL